MRGLAEAGKQRSFGKRSVQPKSINQRRYLEAIEKNDMVFGVGPAGTGKTYLAVAMAISALMAKRVNRIVLARPAVEAGERLGFLPGTLQEKVDPYLRPLYDALYDMLEPDKVDRYLEKNVIEIAPIAFMRGRTLNDAFVILDEAQNTTSEQMKMFVTRLGFNSKAVITGDITQIDLPNANRSGLVEASDILGNVEGIHFCYFDEGDVVRHHLVQRIIRAYDDHKGRNEQLSLVPGTQERQWLCNRAQQRWPGVHHQRRAGSSAGRNAPRRSAAGIVRSHFRVELGTILWEGFVPSHLFLKRKVLLLDHQPGEVRERALALFAGKAQRAVGLAR